MKTIISIENPTQQTILALASVIAAYDEQSSTSSTVEIPASSGQAPALVGNQTTTFAPSFGAAQVPPSNAVSATAVPNVGFNGIPTQQTPTVATVPQMTYQQPAAPAPAAVPTASTNYTMDQLALAATQLMDAGRQADLFGLLQGFGVPALTALPKEQYGAFATQLRAMGAKI
jgi:hypothetical protein